MKRTFATAVCLLLSAGCAGSGSPSGFPRTPSTGTAAADATYFCRLVNRPYATAAERAAGLTEAERMFQQRRPFPDTPRNRAISHAAVQLTASLQAPEHSPSQAEVEAGLLPVSDALAALRKACSG